VDVVGREGVEKRSLTVREVPDCALIPVVIAASTFACVSSMNRIVSGSASSLDQPNGFLVHVDSVPAIGKDDVDGSLDAVATEDVAEHGQIVAVAGEGCTGRVMVLGFGNAEPARSRSGRIDHAIDGTGRR
jgi:hypothetical protein